MFFRYNWEIQSRPTIGKIPLSGTQEDLANTLGSFQVLPEIFSKNNLQEHLFTFLKSIQQNHYLLNDSDQAWFIERDIHKVLPFPNLTHRGEYTREDKI